MNGEYSMNHYDGIYNERDYDYQSPGHETSDKYPPILMMFIIIACSLSLNLFKCFINEERQEEVQINKPLLIEEKNITDEKLLEDNCVICLETLKGKKITKLGCNHLFHYNCLLTWVEKENTCPLCRVILL